MGRNSIFSESLSGIEEMWGEGEKREISSTNYCNNHSED